MSRPPDILWIVTTQWRGQACGFSGDTNARTPCLDAFAREAVVFEQAFSNHPFGPFARALLLTGRPCPENGIMDYWDPLPRDSDTIARRLAAAGYIGEVSFHPNLNHAEKLAFLSALDVFSVPAHYGEAFGLYLIEALAAGVPIVQPRTAAFPEIVEASGAGVLCEPDNPKALGEAIENLLLDPERVRTLGEVARTAAAEKFSATEMARNTLKVFTRIAGAA